jgi:hypothetical protein
VVPRPPTDRAADPREGVEAVSLAMASTAMPAEAAMSSEARMSGKTVTPTRMGQTAMIPVTVVPAVMPTTPSAIVEIDRALDRGGVSIGVRRRAVIGSGCASRQDKTGSGQERYRISHCSCENHDRAFNRRGFANSSERKSPSATYILS